MQASRVRLLVALAAAFAALGVAGQATWNGWTTLLYHQCDSEFELFPEFPLSTQVSVSLVESLVNEAKALALERAACKCGASADYDPSVAEILFDPMTALFNILAENPVVVDPNSCLARAFPRNLMMLNVLKLNLPETCSSTTWADGDCFFQMPLPDLHLSLAVALKPCAGSTMPAASVDCSGEGCINVFTPCNSARGNSDCTGPVSGYTQVCDDILDTQTTNYYWPNTMFDAFQTGIPVYNRGVQSPGCMQKTATPTTRTVQNDITTSLLTFATSQAGLTRSLVEPWLCGGFEITNIGPNILPQLTADYWQVTEITTGPLQCWQTPDPPPSYGYNTTRVVQITQKALTSWNGVFPSGRVALSAPQMLPTQPYVYYINPTQRRLVQWTCNGQISVNVLGQQFSVQLPQMPEIVQYINDLVFQMLTCEASPKFTEESFTARFAMWTPLFWLLTLEQGAAESYPNTYIPNYEDYRQLLFSIYSSLIKPLASSFSFQLYRTEKVSALDWAGLQSLLGLDVTLRLRIAQCDDNPAMLTATVDCVGADCSFFDGLRPCSTNAECPSSQICVDIFNQFDTKFGTSFKADDWFAFYLQGENIDPTDYCTNVPFEQRQSNFEQSCSGPQKFWSTVASVMGKLFGGPNAPPVPSNNFGSFCFVDPIVFNSNFLADWANTLTDYEYTNSRYIYTINFVTAAPLEEAFPAPAPTATATPTADPGDDDTAGGLTSGQIAGIVVGGIAACAIMFALGYFVAKRAIKPEHAESTVLHEPLLSN